MDSDDLELSFPNLQDTGYQITSPEDKRYNCIAWAAGKNNRWWWPGTQVLHYWPGNRQDQSIDEFIEVFRGLGYELCKSRDLEPGYEKVALFANSDGPQHMARQLDSGQWTSKCGKAEDITHKLEGLEGALYGSVVAVMKRRL